MRVRVCVCVCVQRPPLECVARLATSTGDFLSGQLLFKEIFTEGFLSPNPCCRCRFRFVCFFFFFFLGGGEYIFFLLLFSFLVCFGVGLFVCLLDFFYEHFSRTQTRGSTAGEDVTTTSLLERGLLIAVHAHADRVSTAIASQWPCS